MARRQLGKRPENNADVTDKLYVDTEVATRYLKPVNGIPNEDIADDAVTIPKIDATGSADSTTVLFGDGRWDIVLGNSIYLTPSTDLTLDPPEDPVDSLMVMYEIRPTAGITVTVSSNIKRTLGIADSLYIPVGSSGFFGIRYSGPAAAWHLLAATVETL